MTRIDQTKTFTSVVLFNYASIVYLRKWFHVVLVTSDLGVTVQLITTVCISVYSSCFFIDTRINSIPLLLLITPRIICRTSQFLDTQLLFKYVHTLKTAPMRMMLEVGHVVSSGQSSGSRSRDGIPGLRLSVGSHVLVHLNSSVTKPQPHFIICRHGDGPRYRILCR